MDDLISRQAAIDAVQKYKCEHGYDYYDCACDIEKDLKDLPSAQPERKRGEWEHIPYQTMHYGVRCNLCHYKVVNRQNFCPHCGAYMRGDKTDG